MSAPRACSHARCSSLCDTCQGLRELEPLIRAALRQYHFLPHDVISDLVQDVLFEVARRMGLGQKPEDLRGLAVEVAHWRVRDLLRRHRRRAARIELPYIEDETPARISLDEFWRDLQEALSLMAEDAREVFQKHFLDGQSLTEVATELNATLHEIRLLCAEGRDILRKLWDVE